MVYKMDGDRKKENPWAMIPKINNCPQYEKSKYCGKIVQASPSQCTRVLSRTCTWDELIEKKMKNVHDPTKLTQTIL